MISQENKPEDWFDWAESFLTEWKTRDTEWSKSFSPDAARVIELATQAARSLGQNYVGTEHLLAGMLKLRSGAAAVALKRTGMTLSLLREEIELERGVVRAEKTERSIPYTPRCKGIIARAEGRFRNSGVRAEVEDLLLELPAETEGLPARVFSKRGIDVGKLKSAIARGSRDQ